VDVIVFDSNTRLREVREYDTAGGRVPNLKAVYGDIGIRSLSRTTRAYNAIGSGRTTIKNREIARAVIAKGNWVALCAMEVRYFQLFIPDASPLEEDTVARPEAWFVSYDSRNSLPR
jgi:hypothetical protein